MSEDDLNALIVDMSTASPELKDQVFRVALSMYLGETCPYCLKSFTTLEDLHEAVYNGYTDYGRIAHKNCFDKAHEKDGEG